MKKILDKIKNFKLSISVYLALLMGVVIIIVAFAFIIFTLGNIKNMVGSYESDIIKLQKFQATTIAYTIKLEKNNKNLTTTKNLLNFFKTENLFTYFYLKDNESGDIILGKEDYENIYNLKTPTTKSLSQNIQDYTMYYGIETEDRLGHYNNSFIELITTTMFLVVLVGILASIIFTSIISKPLQDVSNAAKKITDGDFDIKIQKTNFSEINELIYSYNEMAFQLNELYSSLELKVQERTIALERANYKLQETQAMMVHSEKMRSLGELVAGIAHEINNPVNFIHGNIMILQNYVSDLLELIDLYEANNGTIPETIKAQINTLKEQIDLDFLRDDVKDLIRSCIEGTERTKNIVLDLKNFSRMEEMVLTQFDIPKEIDTTLNILNNKYKNRITVIKNYAQDTPKIEAYGGQLNQVFMNILDNAQDAMKETGTLTVNTYKVDDKVKIEFIDTGSGIPEENLKKIFDPFFTTKAVGKGTGLGMSISYRVINDHHGRIEVDSTVGKGTKFTITLPIVHEQNALSEEDEVLEDLRKENGVK